MIQISSSDVSGLASSLDTMNTSVQDVFSQIRQMAHSIEASWNSPAGAAFMEQFNSLTPHFDNYVQLLQSYSSFLHQTAELYQENETMIKQGMAC